MSDLKRTLTTGLQSSVLACLVLSSCIFSSDDKSSNNTCCLDCEIDPTPSQVPIPEVPLVMDGYRARPTWNDYLQSVNVIIGKTDDAEIVKQMRREQKLFCYSRNINDFNSLHPNGASPWEFVEYLTSPFRDDLDGTLPGGFDGVAFSEVRGPRYDGNNDPYEGVGWLTSALLEARRQYPNKMILVYGTRGVVDERNDGQTYEQILGTVYQIADLYMQEVYFAESDIECAECNRNICCFKTKQEAGESPYDCLEWLAERVGDVPGLLGKTVFTLSADSAAVENDAEIDFFEHLDRQVSAIANPIDPANRPVGVGFWTFYRAHEATIQHIGRLLEHYYISELGYPTLRGELGALVKNADFRNAETGWTLAPGVGGAAEVVRYSDDGLDLPYWEDIIAREDGPCTKPRGRSHYCLRITRGTESSHARQSIELDPGGRYLLRVFVLGSSESGVRLVVREEAGEIDPLLAEVRKSNLSTAGWQRVEVEFVVPPSGRVRFAIYDSPSSSGSRIWCDNVTVLQLGP